MTLSKDILKPHGRLRFWHEAATAARFGAVGVTATAVHIAVVWLLLSHTFLPTLLANTFAFMTAFGVSFGGNYLWTFRSPGDVRKTLRRFLAISVAALAANTLLLAGLLRTGLFSPLAAVVVAVPAIAAITFVASRLWGFEAGEKATQ